MMAFKKDDNLKTITIQMKVYPQHTTFLNRSALEVNQVWNYCNQVSFKAIQTYTGPATWLSAFDLNNLMVGMTESSENRNGFRYINSDTCQRVAQEYVTRRIQFKKAKLKWRKSFGSGKSLGWIPFKNTSISLLQKKKFETRKNKQGVRFRYRGKAIRVFNPEWMLEHLSIPTAKMGSGHFSQNSLGEWFLNITVSIDKEEYKTYLISVRGYNQVGKEEVVGLDPGLKNKVTCSKGKSLEGEKFYAKGEQKIANAQRRGHKKQSKRLNLKVKNQRQNENNQFVRDVVNQFQTIKMGDFSVKNTNSNKTKLKGHSKLNGHQKAYNDQALGNLKTLLLFKGVSAGRSVVIVNEDFTTQACSSPICRKIFGGKFPVVGPRGRKSLDCRIWTCKVCGTVHERDKSSAICMEFVPEGGVLPIVSRKDVKNLIQIHGLENLRKMNLDL